MEEIDLGHLDKYDVSSKKEIPIPLMDSLLIRNLPFQGKKVVDIGCGNGALTRKMAMRRANVVGIDPSEELLKQATALNETKNFKIHYLLGCSEDTKLQDSEYDIVTVMRAWRWFDRLKALQEARRILKVKGSLVIIESGFMISSPLVQKTFEVLNKDMPEDLQKKGEKDHAKQKINGFPIEWFDEWSTNGFEMKDFYKLSYKVNYTKEEWMKKVASFSLFMDLSDEKKRAAVQNLSQAMDGLGGEEKLLSVPHDCNVCILRPV